ncbi:MAG: sulfite exporter TauE/SafE family protein [Phycisphaerales bacterium]|nr:sulfite exporter TauE/SafE family protein [Phycisphaerales bacterium]
MIFIVLPLVALFTSAISAVLGGGGGILLLAVTYMFLPHKAAILLHATVQTVNHTTRVISFLPHVEWGIVGRFLSGVVVGSGIGIAILDATSHSKTAEPWFKLIVGAYVVIFSLLPLPTRKDGPRWYDFPILGVASGIAAFTVGAIGPLIGPLFARRGFAKERLIATKSACEWVLHLAKIPVFLTYQAFTDLREYLALSALMCAVVIPGTLIGRRLLGALSEEQFLWLFRGMLAIAGAKIMLWDGIRPLVFDTGAITP